MLRRLVPVVVALAALVTAGCPPNTCFLQVCTNGDCRCSISSCADGADYDLGQKTCVCKQGYVSVSGQCLTPAQADAFCGASRRWAEGGCVEKTCPAGHELDEGTGQCQAVAAVAGAIGVDLAQGQTLGCPEGQRLVVEGQNAACVPIDQTCGRDEVFDGKRCVKAQQCPTGSVFDPATGGCVAFGQASESQGFVVEVASWAQANYGRDGQSGTASFCGAFTKKPWAFGVGEGKSALVRIGLTLTFGEAQIANASVAAATSFEVTGNPVPERGAALVGEAAESILATLRAGGGRASAPSHALTVKCPVVHAAKPIVVPATGGV
jgi:hypothetical protein